MTTPSPCGNCAACMGFPGYGQCIWWYLKIWDSKVIENTTNADLRKDSHRKDDHTRG